MLDRWRGEEGCACVQLASGFKTWRSSTSRPYCLCAHDVSAGELFEAQKDDEAAAEAVDVLFLLGIGSGDMRVG